MGQHLSWGGGGGGRENYAISITYGVRAPLLANKIDGDCFALVRAHQHDIFTIRM